MQSSKYECVVRRLYMRNPSEVPTKRAGALARMRRWRGDDRGFTAVEFALVIGPFLAILFAILEVALVFFASSALDNAVKQAARTIRTGEAQSANEGAQALLERICERLPVFVVCNDLVLDVRTFDNFGQASAGAGSPLNGDGDMIGQCEAAFQMPAASQVVLVTVHYRWRLIASLPNPSKFIGLSGLGLGNLPDGSRLITTSLAFRVEPYNGDEGTGGGMPGC